MHLAAEGGPRTWAKLLGNKEPRPLGKPSTCTYTLDSQLLSSCLNCCNTVLIYNYIIESNSELHGFVPFHFWTTADVRAVWHAKALRCCHKPQIDHTALQSWDKYAFHEQLLSSCCCTREGRDSPLRVSQKPHFLTLNFDDAIQPAILDVSGHIFGTWVQHEATLGLLLSLKHSTSFFLCFQN